MQMFFFSPIFGAPGAGPSYSFFFTLLYIYSITQHTSRFYGFCCEFKVCPYDMSHPWRIEPTTLESHPSALCFYRYSLQQAQGFPHGLSYDFWINFLYIMYSRAGNSLIGFPGESLVFCPKMSKCQ